MADRIVIYDPERELGAIIDGETLTALGPVGGGPNARAELEAFVAAMPEAVWKLYSGDLVAAYLQFWGEHFAADHETPAESGSGPVVEPGPAGDDAHRLAAMEASAGAAGPPEPGPADPDMEPDTSPPHTVNAEGVVMLGEFVPEPVGPQPGDRCFACKGTGTVPGATVGELVVCGLCNGTKVFPPAVVA